MKVKEFVELLKPYYGKGYIITYDYDEEEGYRSVAYICEYKDKLQLSNGDPVGEIGYKRGVEIKDKWLRSLEHLIDIINLYGWYDEEIGIEMEDVDGIAVLTNIHENTIILTSRRYKLMEIDVQPWYSTASEINQTVEWLVGEYSERRY